MMCSRTSWASLLELVVGEVVQVLRAVDAVEKRSVMRCAVG